MDASLHALLPGQPLPTAAQRALVRAASLRAEPQAELAALMQAQELAPEHPEVLIAFYRYHFYGHRLRPARAVARQALVVGAAALDLPSVWRQVPAQALPGARFDGATRFYLFSLKAYAYLSLRLDENAEARDALALLRALDPEDRVGGALLEGVRQRAAAAARGEPAPDEAAPVTGAAAWARWPDLAGKAA